MYSDVESYAEAISGKKTNKPLMEKKRRARINRCLSELKDILIRDNHASAGHAKWEKADILEMTVDYVKKLREHKGIPEVTRPVPVPSSTDDSEEGREARLPSKSPASVSSPPSTSSTEFASEPPEAKRRRRSEMEPLVAAPVPHAPTAVHPGFNFFAHQLFAIQQYQQHMKMATAAPPMIPGATLGATLPSPVAMHIPWRM